MSDKTINELVELTDVSQTDELIIYDSSETEGNPTKKVKVESLVPSIVSKVFENPIDNTKFALSATGGTNVTAQCTGLLYVQFAKTDASTTVVFEDDTALIGSDLYISGVAYYISFTILIRKGHQYKWLQAGVNTIQNQNFIPFC